METLLLTSRFNLQTVFLPWNMEATNTLAQFLIILDPLSNDLIMHVISSINALSDCVGAG